MAQTMGRLVTSVLPSKSEMQPRLSPTYVRQDEDGGMTTDDDTSTVCAPEDSRGSGTLKSSPSHPRAAFPRRALEVTSRNTISTRPPLTKTSSHSPAWELEVLPPPPTSTPPLSNRDAPRHTDNDIDWTLPPPPRQDTPSPPPSITETSTPPPELPPRLETPPAPPPPPPEIPKRTPPPNHPLTHTPPLADNTQEKTSKGLQPRTPDHVAASSLSMSAVQRLLSDIPDIPPSPPNTTSTGSPSASPRASYIPPPPLPMSSPPLDEPASENRRSRKEQSSNILSPMPRRPAKPLGNLQRGMHGRHHRPAPSDDSVTSGSNNATDKFPPTYPAFQRRTRHLRTMSQTKADMTRGITITTAKLEERNGHVPMSRQSEQSRRRDPKPANAQVMWSAVQKRREDLYKKRLDMSQDRDALRRLRSRKDEAENLILTILRRLLPSVEDEFRRSFADIQMLSDEYMVIEREYEEKELSLDKLEEELFRLETKFFTNIAAEQLGMEVDSHNRHGEERAPGKEVPRSPRMSRKEVPLEVRGIPADGVREGIHPLYQEFQDAVGEFNLASENWHELQTAKDNIELRVTINKHVPGQSLDEEELEFLDDYPEEESRRLKQLQEAHADVERLRALCLERGAMRKDIPFHLAYVLRRSFPHESDERDLGEDIDLPGMQSSDSLEGMGQGGEGRQLARPLFPRLLVQEPHLFGEFPILPEQALRAAEDLPKDDPKRDARIRDAEAELQWHQILASDKHHPSTMVDRWLFHQLRLSPRMAHLWVNLALSWGFRLGQSWEQDLLDSWWDDEVVSDVWGGEEDDGEWNMGRSGAVGGSDVDGREVSAMIAEAVEVEEIAIEATG